MSQLPMLFFLSLSFRLLVEGSTFRGGLAHEKGVSWFNESLLFGMLVTACVAHQFMTALACQPSSMVFDSLFMSTLGVQLTGFFGCLAIACALGSMFPILKQLESFAQSPLKNPIKDA
jgi:hypothetical protein